MTSDEDIQRVCEACGLASPTLAALGAGFASMLAVADKAGGLEREETEEEAEAFLRFAERLDKRRNRIRMHRDFGRALSHMRRCESSGCRRLSILPQYYCDECECRATLVAAATERAGLERGMA